MAEFEEKLSAILGNEAAMSQIMALAQSFSGGGQPSEPPSTPEVRDWEPVPEATPTTEEGNPLAMLGDLDPRLIQMGMRLLGEYQGENSQSMALLTAIRPYIRSEKYGKLDRAIQLARLARLVRVALQSLGEGVDHV